MKLKKIIFMMLLAVLTITGCKEGNTTSNGLESSTSTDDGIGDEVYSPYPVETIYQNTSCIRQIFELKQDGELIGDRFITDPARVTKNNLKKVNYISRCPVDKMQGEVVIYTPNYFMRNTDKRDENVKEYTIIKEDNKYYVDSINESSETYIPLNGFVVSIPDSKSQYLYEGKEIEIVGHIFDTYEIGIYTDRGTRIVIDEINNVRWGNHVSRAHFIDNRSDYKQVVRSGLMDIVTFDFNKETNSYEITSYDRRTYDNALMIPQTGFMLLNYVTADPTWIEEGLVFQKGDKVYLDQYDEPYKEDITYAIGDNEDCKVTIFQNAGQPTGQNEWGYEIAVTNNKVVGHAVNINVPLVANSYVIRFSHFSGTVEGEIARLRKLFKVGVTIERTGSSITIKYDAGQFGKDYVNSLLNHVDNLVLDSEEKFYDFDITRVKKLREEMVKIPAELDYVLNTLGVENNLTNQYYYTNLMYYAKYLDDQATLSGMQNSPVETRSIWHYPDGEDTLEEIKATVSNLSQNNFNEVIVSAMSLNGYANFDSKYLAHSIIAKTGYGDYKDYLEAFVSEAHKVGLKVQISVCNWFEYEGLIEKSPEFANYFAINVDGSEGSNSGEGEITKFLDPTNAKVREMYQDIYYEIANNYDIDGLHLDYIRYGAGNNYYESSQGYTDAAAAGFITYCQEYEPAIYNNIKSITTGEELNAKCKGNSLIYGAFCDYRRSVITNYVYEIRQLLKDDQKLSLAVVSDKEYAKNGKLQDWGTWVEAGWIDSLHLMAYYCDYGKVESDSIIALQAANNKSYVVSGVAPVGMGLEIMEVFTQLAAARNVNAQGTAIFATHSFTRRDLGQYLNGKEGQGLYNTKAIVAYDSIKNVMSAYMNTLKYRADRIYKESGFMSADQYNSLIRDIEALLNSLKDDDNACRADVGAKLNTMTSTIYGTGEVHNRIQELLNEARTNLIIKEN